MIAKNAATMRRRSGYVRFLPVATILFFFVAFLSGFTEEIAVRRLLRMSSEEIRSTPCEGEEFDRIQPGGDASGAKPSIDDPVVLVTAKFGYEDMFHDDVARHASCLSRAGPFDVSDMYVYSTFPKFITDDPRWERHLRFLQDEEDDSARGGGYWFWKPNLILHHMADLPDGGFLVFADNDRIDYSGWTAKIVQDMSEKNMDFAIEQLDGGFFQGRGMMPYRERMYTKGDTYVKFGVRRWDRSMQYQANYMVLRKTESSVQFMEDWKEAVSDYHVLSDEPSVRRNHRSYIEHRHDQSMISMLLKYKWGEPKKTLFDHWTPVGSTWMFDLSAEGMKHGDDLVKDIMAKKEQRQMQMAAREHDRQMIQQQSKKLGEFVAQKQPQQTDEQQAEKPPSQ